MRTAAAPAAVGAPIQTDGLTVTVLSVDTDAAPPPTLELDDGDRFMAVVVLCRAGGSGREAISPYDWQVSDAGGGVYGPVVDGLGGTLPERTIGPGQSVRGRVGFVVPRSAAGLLLHFDAELGEGSALLPLP